MKKINFIKFRKPIIIILFFIIIVIFLLSHCCDGIPRKTSEKMYELGVAALETADDFIDGEIAGAEAERRLKNNYNEAELQYKIQCEELDTDTLVGTEYKNDTFIESDILFLKWAVRDKVDGTGTEEDVISKRNDLAKSLGKRKR